MNQERENDSTKKRKHWVQAIRRKQIDQLFQLERIKLTTTSQFTQSRQDQHQQIVEEIKMTIYHFDCCAEKEILGLLITLDPSWGLFYQITGYVPENTPLFIASFVQEQLKSIFDPPGSYAEGKNLIASKMRQWQKQKSSKLDNIIENVNKLKDLNMTLFPQLVNFLNFIINILSIGRWSYQSQEDLDHKDPFSDKIQRQRESCFSILNNVLSLSDHLLQDYLPQIFYSTGRSFDLITLYYNMFLIKADNRKLKMEMVWNYVRLLAKHPEQFLQRHRQFVQMILIGIAPFGQVQKALENEFLEVGKKIIDLLNDIMKCLALAYDNSLPRQSEDQDPALFMMHLTGSLKILSANKYLVRQIMQASYLVKMFRFHLRISQNQSQLTTSNNIAYILSNAACDEHGYTFLSNYPFLIVQAKTILKKYSERKQKNWSYKQCCLMAELLFLLGNLCDSPLVFEEQSDESHQEEELFDGSSNHKIIETIEKLFLYLPISNVASQARENIRYLYLNLLLMCHDRWKCHYISKYLQSYLRRQSASILFCSLVETKNPKDKVSIRALQLFRDFLIISQDSRIVFNFVNKILKQKLMQKRVNEMVELFDSYQFVLLQKEIDRFEGKDRNQEECL